MKTSYYAKVKNDFPQLSVAISVFTPSWYKGRKFERLAPPWELVNKYKNNKISSKKYKEMYYSAVLNKLNPSDVYDELGEDAILICYEAPDAFCHRHIVAEWLEENLGVKIEELK